MSVDAGVATKKASSPGTRPLGPTAAFLPTIGQGTYDMEREPVEAVDALRHGIELGLTHIDTAELYGNGAVESMVGRAIRSVRHRVFLASKVDPARASRRGLIDSCEQSLRRLGTDRLDLYLLHWVAPYPVEDTVAGFEELVAAGKIRYWGVSNFDEIRLAEIIDIAGEGRIVCNQVMHHLGQRRIEHAVVPFCRERQIAIVGYSPFGAGSFPPPGDFAGEVLRDVAEGLGATPRQVALAFLCHASRGFTIPKACRRAHVEENAAAMNLVLPDDAARQLDSAFPVGPHTGGVPTW